MCVHDLSSSSLCAIGQVTSQPCTCSCSGEQKQRCEHCLQYIVNERSHAGHEIESKKMCVAREFCESNTQTLPLWKLLGGYCHFVGMLEWNGLK